ncbi:MAG: hypothetical protein L6Q99_06270 [Planctomycetes bacterium]|nr:hypothetical protein [Planctomycetota bacterium]
MDADTYPDMILHLPSSANRTWRPYTSVQFPKFSDEHYTARDPHPELYHPFAYAVNSTGGIGFFIRGWRERNLAGCLLTELPEEEEVWVRISKEDWDRARDLFYGGEDYAEEDYRETFVEGVLANFEFQRVRVRLNPMFERGEIEVHVQFLDDL